MSKMSAWLDSLLRRAADHPQQTADGAGERLAAIEAQVDDSPGWVGYTRRLHERDVAEVQSLYEDALTAYRKNPIAWRIIATTTNYVVGDRGPDRPDEALAARPGPARLRARRLNGR